MYPTANPKVLQRARQILAYDPIFIDTETTGFSPDDVVIEIGVVDLNGDTLYESLIKPSTPIPPDSIAVHGITAWAAIVGDVEQAQSIARPGAAPVLTSGGVEKGRVEVHTTGQFAADAPAEAGIQLNARPGHDERYTHRLLVKVALVKEAIVAD